MKIGFYRDALIGDNLVALNAIYAIKALYPSSQLIVYTNSIGMELYQQFDFIDTLINMESIEHKDLISNINSYHFDVFILTQANRWRCKLLNQTNIKKVISLLSLGSIFKPKFHTIFISRNLSSIPQYQRLLRLVREINPKHFDENFSKIDFSAIILQTQDQHKTFVQDFLQPFSHFKMRVMINPFSRTCSHTLTLQGWKKLIETLVLNYPSILFIIPTYEGNPKTIDFEESPCNLAFFKNTLDLFNLVELTSKIQLLISPSTGNAHIANNLNIPLLGLFSKRDTMLWRGENMKKDLFVIVPTKWESLTPKVEEHLIWQVKQKFDLFLDSQK